MKKALHIVALIPARGGSKRIPKKNIKMLGEHPLIAYSIRQALTCQLINETYVSTEDKAIAKVSRRYGAKIIPRPPSLSSDVARTTDVVRHVFSVLSSENKRPDLIVLLQPTSPLRSVASITHAVKTFIEHLNEYDSLISVRKASFKEGTIQNNCFISLYADGVRSQGLKEKYYTTGAIYIYKSSLLSKENIYGSMIYPYVMQSPIEALDIDDLDDFKMAELILKSLPAPYFKAKPTTYTKHTKLPRRR